MKKLQARLGVNIDHVATLRQQRGENYPSIQRAALAVLEAGADQITIHLREDRRHIQDADVPVVQEACRAFGKPLNLELGCHPEIVAIAAKQKPEWVCLVPEKREERTTEGGLAVTDAGVFKRVQEAIETILARSPTTKVSLFVEARPAVLETCLSLPAHAVEIHTGDYAHAFQRGQSTAAHLESFKRGHQQILAHGWGYHAGHGITDKSLVPLLGLNVFAEYNIGHWIIAESVYRGLSSVVRDLQIQLRE
jgi:pyridoxine 5-phosphate synthase